jgi:hypothetical protein
LKRDGRGSEVREGVPVALALEQDVARTIPTPIGVDSSE